MGGIPLQANIIHGKVITVVELQVSLNKRSVHENNLLPLATSKVPVIKLMMEQFIFRINGVKENLQTVRV